MSADGLAHWELAMASREPRELMLLDRASRMLAEASSISVFVTTNRPFENWTEVLGNERRAPPEGWSRSGPRPADAPLPHPGNQRRELPPERSRAPAWRSLGEIF